MLDWMMEVSQRIAVAESWTVDILSTARLSYAMGLDHRQLECKSKKGAR